MPNNTDPPYDRLETILMGGTVDPPYTRKELIAMQAGGGSGGGSGSGEYDAVIRVDSNQIQNVQNATLESGTFEDMKAKALSYDPLKIMVYGYRNDEGYSTVTTFDMLWVYFDTYETDPEAHYFVVSVLAPYGYGNVGLTRMDMSINYDGTITIFKKYIIQMTVLS